MSTQPTESNSPERIKQFSRLLTGDIMESICMQCFQTLRADTLISMKEAEETHFINCPLRPYKYKIRT
jgi:hypothetical protein